MTLRSYPSVLHEWVPSAGEGGYNKITVAFNGEDYGAVYLRTDDCFYADGCPDDGGFSADLTEQGIDFLMDALRDCKQRLLDYRVQVEREENARQGVEGG